MASQTKRQSQYVVTLRPGSLFCLVAAQDLIIKWNESRGCPVDVIREHELICYLRTLIELGERMEWRGNAYNFPMVVGRPRYAVLANELQYWPARCHFHC